MQNNTGFPDSPGLSLFSVCVKLWSKWMRTNTASSTSQWLLHYFHQTLNMPLFYYFFYTFLSSNDERKKWEGKSCEQPSLSTVLCLFLNLAWWIMRARQVQLIDDKKQSCISLLQLSDVEHTCAVRRRKIPLICIWFTVTNHLSVMIIVSQISTTTVASS